MAQLGCDPVVEVVIIDLPTGETVADDLPVTALSWERVLSDVSTASLTVSTGQAPDCCSKLAGVRTWRHALQVWRDGSLAGEWVITRITGGRDTMVFGAHDPMIYLKVRVIHHDLAFTGADLAVIAEAVIKDAMVPDDPQILPSLTVSPSGLTGDRKYTANTSYAWDVLTELMRAGLDVTCIGRRIIIGSAPGMIGNTAQLGCRDFTSDVNVIEDGLAAATRAVVAGSGVTGTAGGTDSYFGLIEYLAKEESITTGASANGTAANYVAAGNPPPVYVEPPSGSNLAGTAPVTMAQLVPGTRVPVSLECGCRTAFTDLLLSKLAVTWSATGEAVTPTLIPLTTNATQLATG